MSVQPFKKGPDYIDPLWLGRAAGRPCRNLDFHTMARKEILDAFARHAAAADIAVIEANKGLYDGLDVEGRDSNAALAQLLAAPVVLVIDTRGMTRGIAPLVRGYLDFDREVDIEGVILNQVGGPRHESKLLAALARYTDLPVLGAVGRDPSLTIPERHLGLIPANEAVEADTTIARLADAVSKGVDLDRIVAVAEGAAAHRAPVPDAMPARPTEIRIAVARDAAFGFYYPDDLEAFARAGATLVPFDTLSDARLPDADGLFIGGGFPETQMAALSANASLRESIREALSNGLPAYAECGGLMYLARSIAWRGERHDMAGVIPADAVVHERPRGRGYMTLAETAASPWPAPEGAPSTLAAHEFHYASLENLPGDTVYAYRVLRGTGIDGRHDGIVIGNLLASFMHQRNVAANRWVDRFVAFVHACKNSSKTKISRDDVASSPANPG
jgi:cobyrinic acid a,c-diamide synthase